MVNPFDDSMAMDNTLEAYLERNEGFKIYTHSAKTRTIALLMFGAYMVLFGFFVNFVRGKFYELNQSQDFLLAMNDLTITKWLFFIIALLGIFLAFLLFLYMLWSVVDIWGLQVCVSPMELRVQNTISGPYFRNWTGVGSMLMEDIHMLKGTRLATYVISQHTRVRFSPVDQVDLLIQDIMTHGNNIKTQ